MSQDSYLQSGGPCGYKQSEPPVCLRAGAIAIGIELTPGLATRASCPEAMWQAARWWHPYYLDRAPSGAGTAGPSTPAAKSDKSAAQHQPKGAYWICQPEASIKE
jgi:hypothetical protein